MALALVDLEKSEIPFSSELRREITERRKQTEEWIKAREPQLPEKTESLAGWVVYEHQRGDPERATKLLDELLSRRRDDGGWESRRATQPPTHHFRCSHGTEDERPAERQSRRHRDAKVSPQ